MESKFDKKKKYRNLVVMNTPNGIVKEGEIFTGEQWENILVYGVGNGFERMFEVIS